MINTVILKRVIVTVFSAALYVEAGFVHAFDMCNTIFDKMRQTRINQAEWRGENRYRDDYYGDPGIAPGYGPLRGRGYGYGSPAYGFGARPTSSYRFNVPAYAAPQPGTDALQAEIYQLKQRLKSLENALNHESSQRQSPQTDPGTGQHFAGM